MRSTQSPLILHPLRSHAALRLLLGLFFLVCVSVWLSPAALPIQIASTLLAISIYFWERHKLRRDTGIERLILKPNGDWTLRTTDGPDIEVPAARMRAEILPGLIRLSFDSRLDLTLFPDSLGGDGFRVLKVRLRSGARR